MYIIFHEIVLMKVSLSSDKYLYYCDIFINRSDVK